MTSALTRNEFRAYAYALWSRQMASDATAHYASWKNRPEPGDGRDIYQGERLVLQNILRETSTDTTNTTGDIGYLPIEEAIFISRDRCEEVTQRKGERARGYFSEGRPLPTRFSTASLRQEPIRVEELLTIDQDFLRAQLGVTASEIPYAGQVVVKNADGLTWIKLVRQHARVSPRITEAALNVGSTVIVERLGGKPEPWWQRREPGRDLTSLQDEAFAACCHDLLSAVREEHAGVPLKTTDDSSRIARSEDFTIIEVFAATVTIDAVLDALRPVFASGTAWGDVLIVLCTKSDDKSVDRTIGDAMRHVGGTDILVVVAALPELHTLLSKYPWVWSKYLGEAYSFRVLQANPATIGEIGDPSEAPPGLPMLERPELENLGDEWRGLLITGRPGAGASVTLRQVIAQRFDGAVVITDHAGRETLDQQDLPLIKALLANLSTERECLIVIEHVDHDERWQVARELLRVTRASASVKVVATAWTTEKLGTLLNDVIIVDIAAPRLPFRRRLMEAVAAYASIPCTSKRVEHEAERSMRTLATPREIVAANTTLTDPRVRRELRGWVGKADVSHPYWRDRYDRLTPEERDVLGIIHLLRRYGWKGIDRQILETYLHHTTPRTDLESVLLRFDGAWLRTWLGELVMPNPPHDLFFAFGDEPSSIARRFIRATIELPLDPEWKRAALGNHIDRACFATYPAECAAIARALAQLEPEDSLLLPSVAADLMRFGERAEVEQLMARFLSSHPDRHYQWSEIVRSAEDEDGLTWAATEFFRGAFLHPEWADDARDDEVPEHVEFYRAYFQQYVAIPELRTIARSMLTNSRWIHIIDETRERTIDIAAIQRFMEADH